MTAVILLTGCGLAKPELPENTYAVPIDRAFAILSQDKLRDALDAWQCGVPVKVDVSQESAEDGRPVVRWDLVSGGQSQMDLRATLTPVDAATTKIDVVAHNGQTGVGTGDDVFYPRPVIEQPVVPLIEEEIAAALLNRPFAIENVLETMNRKNLHGDNDVCSRQRDQREDGKQFSVNDDWSEDFGGSRSHADAPANPPLPAPGQPAGGFGRPMTTGLSR